MCVARRFSGNNSTYQRSLSANDWLRRSYEPPKSVPGCISGRCRFGVSARRIEHSPSVYEAILYCSYVLAFAALRDPVSRAYYARKIGQGKRHNQALIALARRRCDVLFAMLRDGTLYSPPQPKMLLTTT